MLACRLNTNSLSLTCVCEKVQDTGSAILPCDHACEVNNRIESATQTPRQNCFINRSNLYFVYPVYRYGCTISKYYPAACNCPNACLHLFKSFKIFKNYTHTYIVLIDK